MPRSTKRSLEYYSSALPEGVTLKWMGQTRSYRLCLRDGTKLDERHVDTVLKWRAENAPQVFSYIAKRAMRSMQMRDADA